MFYGVTRQKQIVEMIKDVCTVLSPSNTPESIELLMGTCCAETGLGTAKDTYADQGRGLMQFDEVRYNDVRKYIIERRPELRQQIISEWGIDFEKIGFSFILDYGPLPSIIACRVGYMMVPEPLPRIGDLRAQARYWKRFWNSSAGKGTPEHYIAQSRKHWFSNNKTI